MWMRSNASLAVSSSTSRPANMGGRRSGSRARTGFVVGSGKPPKLGNFAKLDKFAGFSLKRQCSRRSERVPPRLGHDVRPVPSLRHEPDPHPDQPRRAVRRPRADPARRLVVRSRRPPILEVDVVHVARQHRDAWGPASASAARRAGAGSRAAPADVRRLRRSPTSASCPSYPADTGKRVISRSVCAAPCTVGGPFTSPGSASTITSRSTRSAASRSDCRATPLVLPAERAEPELHALRQPDQQEAEHHPAPPGFRAR